MKELLEICTALRQLDATPCAMATVIQVHGSSYRKPGARMLMTPEARTWGMISGGCLEHDVILHGRQAIQSGDPKVIRYDSTSEEDLLFGTGLGCNGIIDVLVEPVTSSLREGFIDAVESCQHSRLSGALVTLIEGGEKGENHAFLKDDLWSGSASISPLVTELNFEGDKPILFSGILNGAEAKLFVQPLLPPMQLVIFGGWLDAIPLIRIAKEIGFAAILVDSRRRETSLQLYREADRVLLCSPEEALELIDFDDRTVAVLMNHSFERDQEALLTMTKVAPQFLGMLGTKQRHQRILTGLKKEGVIIADQFASNIHSPVGLDIGAKTPAEIALSIMAEILAVINGRSAMSIRDKLHPATKQESKTNLAYA